MKTTRTYLTGCTWCNATGVKYPMTNNGAGFTNVCPVCNGAGIITVNYYTLTEVTEFESSEKEELRKELIKCVDDEPEMPGEIPQTIFMSFKLGDEEYIATTLRSIVKLTKKGIRERIDNYLAQK